MSITKTIELDKFCKSILSADRNVRSVAVLDKKGLVLHNISHPKFMQPSLERWNDIHYMECMFDISMGAKFDELYGPIRYHHSDKDNFMMFSFPYNKQVVIITSTKMISPIAFATKISNIIINSK
ncbi:MAG: hypothetical protein P4K92_04435 [Candidatus Nitrosotalea sp.]|jgi:hypothetical protein|nr:hypothetical protein [Candidatus Nitrosotalea sp.]